MLNIYSCSSQKHNGQVKHLGHLSSEQKCSMSSEFEEVQLCRSTRSAGGVPLHL